MPLAARRLALVVALTAALGATAGCRSEPVPGPTSAEAVTLEVAVTDYSSWVSPTGEPEAETRTETLAEGDGVTVGTIVGDVTITVESIEDGSIDLATNEPLIEATTGSGIDFDDTRQDFTLAPGETIDLTTPTLDAATVIEITFVG